MRRRDAGIAALAMLAAACTIAPAAENSNLAGPVSIMPPRGHGSLLQSEVSMALSSRDLEIMVTPLDESVIRVTAPDTEERLREIGRAHV